MLLLVTPDPDLADVLGGACRNPEAVEVDGLAGVRGSLAGVDVAVHPLGVGRTAVAFALSRLLRPAPRAVLLLTVGPALADAGLVEGNLLAASADTYVDLGEQHSSELSDVAALGVRICPGAPGQTFLSDPRLTTALDAAVDTVGPLHTADLLAADPALQDARRDRWGPALAETREGATVAHVCLLEAVPFAHVRAVGSPGDAGAADALLGVTRSVLGPARDALDWPFS